MSIQIKTDRESEKGVTMLLSVLIMSSLVLIATTVAFLAIQELRSSRAALVSEPALVAAKSGGEEGLWTVKRGNLSDLPDCSVSTTGQGFSASSSYLNYCKSFSGDTIEVTTTPTSILLYNPNDPNGDTDLSDYPYSSLTIASTGSYAVSVNVSRIDGDFISSFMVNPGGTPVTVSLPAAPTGSEGRMMITLQSNGPTMTDITTDRGLPTNLNIVSSGCSSRASSLSTCSVSSKEIFTRKIEVNLNN